MKWRVVLVEAEPAIGHAYNNGGLNNLELSLFDFEMAFVGKHYIGLSRSTFSNMVTFEKFLRSRQSVTTDYIYNLASPLLGLRKDNGAWVDPAAVIA